MGSFHSIQNCKTPLRLGFIGGGLNSAVGYVHYASSHLDGLFCLEAGAFSRDTEINMQTASRYGVDPQRTYCCWQELIASEKDNLDAVVVLTPTPTHSEIVLQLLNADIAVISEKSLASSVNECTVIDQLIKKKSGFLAVTYNYSGYPMFRELVARCHAGELGKIHQIQIEMPQEGFLRLHGNNQRPEPQSWRCIDHGIPTISLDLAVHLHHLIDLVSGGAKPLSVSAVENHTGLVKKVIDNVNALVIYENDLVANFWYSKTALGIRNGLRLRVYGSHGSAEWLQSEPERLTLANSKGGIYVMDPGASGLLEACLPRYQRFKPGHPSGFIEAFANLYTDIATAINNRKSAVNVDTSQVMGATHALEGLCLLEALHESARSNRWVNLNM